MEKQDAANYGNTQDYQDDMIANVYCFGGY
jgi:hypothetical protein